MSNTPKLRVLNRTSGQLQRDRADWGRGEDVTGMRYFAGKRDRNDFISRVRATAHAQRVSAARLMRLFGGDGNG